MSCHLEVFADATQRHDQAFPGVRGREAAACLGVSRCSRRRPNGLRCHWVGFAKAKARHAMSLGRVLEPDSPGCAAAMSRIEASVGRGVPGLSLCVSLMSGRPVRVSRFMTNCLTPVSSSRNSQRTIPLDFDMASKDHNRKRLSILRRNGSKPLIVLLRFHSSELHDAEQW